MFKLIGNLPIGSDSLEKFLEYNCGFVEVEALKVQPGSDLIPMFVLEKEGEPGEILMWTGGDKIDALNLFKARLAARKADRYATINASWYVGFPEDWSNELREQMMERLNREGTKAFPELRKEAYMITVGDRQRTLFAMYNVDRDYKGKIRKLIKQQLAKDADLGGRMANLLVTWN